MNQVKNDVQSIAESIREINNIEKRLSALIFSGPKAYWELYKKQEEEELKGENGRWTIEDRI